MGPMSLFSYLAICRYLHDDGGECRTRSPGWLGDVVGSKPDLLAQTATVHCFQAMGVRAGLLTPVGGCD